MIRSVFRNLLSSPAVSEEEKKRLTSAGFGQRVGYGERPAVLVIDVQNYNVGPREGPSKEYPSGGGIAAHKAAHRISEILKVARKSGVPVIYTQFTLRRDRSDIGIYGKKRTFLDIDGWCVEGSEGAKIHESVKPKPTDIVLTKKRPSAFFGTILNSLLVEKRIDTLIITGGTTSNCVRATAVDAMSFNYRGIVVSDCVYDRVQVSHETTLFDLDRQYADVVKSDEVINYLRSLH
jgi:nicotinamidase-related amidase